MQEPPPNESPSSELARRRPARAIEVREFTIPFANVIGLYSRGLRGTNRVFSGWSQTKVTTYVEIDFLMELPGNPTDGTPNRTNFLTLRTSDEFDASLREAFSAASQDSLATLRAQLSTSAYSNSDQATQIEQLLEDNTCIQCDLRQADLSGADLEEANLEGANLEGADLSGANLKGAYLVGVNLDQANLSEANLSRARLTLATLQNANLSQSTLNIANLQNVLLQNADLSGAEVQGVDLSRSDLTGANLEDADLSQFRVQRSALSLLTNPTAMLVVPTDRYTTVLRDTNLSNANLKGADFQEAVFDSTNLRGADLTDAQLAETDTAGASFCGATMPDGKQSQQGC